VERKWFCGEKEVKKRKTEIVFAEKRSFGKKRQSGFPFGNACKMRFRAWEKREMPG
jgi:hypothetical protein